MNDYLLYRPLGEICWEPTGEAMQTSSCKHSFHAACLAAWRAENARQGGSTHEGCPVCLARLAQLFKTELKVSGENVAEVVDAACVQLGVAKGLPLVEKGRRCWEALGCPAWTPV